MSYQVMKKFYLLLMINFVEKGNVISIDENFFSNFND